MNAVERMSDYRQGTGVWEYPPIVRYSLYVYLGHVYYSYSAVNNQPVMSEEIKKGWKSFSTYM